MAKRPLTDAELRQRRLAARAPGKTGRPRLPASGLEADRLARQRLAVQRARALAANHVVEAVMTLIHAMRGTLPGSDARSMLAASKALAERTGLDQRTLEDLASSSAPVVVRLAIDPSEYPE